MSAISTAEIARMRAHVSTYLLPGTAVIESLSTTQDAGGAPVETWTPVTGGTVACRLDPYGQSSDEVSINWGKETINVLYQLTVPYDAPLAEHTRVTTNSKTYQIVQINSDHTPGWNVSKRAVVNEVR